MQQSPEESDLQREEKEAAEKYARGIEEYRNRLAGDRPGSVLSLLKVPGILFCTGICGYILGWLKFHPWIFIPILYTVGFVLLRRIREFKRSFEAFMYFSLRKKSTVKLERVDWINEIMDKTWRYAESNISKIVLLKVSAVLRKVNVPMISDIRLDRFTLGGQPPVIEGIKIRSSSRDSLVIDASVHFIPALIEEKQKIFELAGIKEREKDWNLNTTLTVRVGGVAAGIDMPVTLKNVSFKGTTRIKLNLGYTPSVIESFEFSFLKQPTISFNIIPLKTVDIMDIPGLATGIKKVISTAIEKEALYPKKVTVSLRPKSIYYVGAMCVFVRNTYTALENPFYIGVGLNGIRQLSTHKITKEKDTFILYLPLRNTDEKIYITLHQTEDSKDALSSTTISVNRICMQSRAHRYAPLTNAMGYIDLSCAYIPKVDMEKASEQDKPKSAIITVRLTQLIDMADHTGKPYKSLSVRMRAYLKEKRPIQKDPADMSAAELMVEERQSQKSVAKNESSTDSEENILQNQQQPQNKELLASFTTKNAYSVTSPAFDDNFVFFTRDTKRTIVMVDALEKGQILGSFHINIQKGISISYGTFDFWNLQTGRAKLLFSAEYACMAKIEMRKYTHIRRIAIQEIDAPGIYSGYIVTNDRVISLHSFFSNGTGEHKAAALVPIIDKKEISKIVLYHKDEVFGGCHAVDGEALLGNTPISISVQEYPLLKQPPTEKNTADNISNDVYVSDKNNSNNSNNEISTEKLKDYSPFVQMRVVVCRVQHPIFLEFTRKGVLLDRSAPSTGKKLFGEFFFFHDDVNISVFTAKENYLIGKFILSKPNGRHEIKLTHGQIFVIDLYTRWISFSAPSPVQKGVLSFSVEKMCAKKDAGLEIYSRIYLEIIVKEEKKITSASKNPMQPSFFESFSFSVFVPLDVFHLRVYGWTLMEEKKVIGEVSIPLLAISPGSSTLDLPISYFSEGNENIIYKIKSKFVLS